MPSCNAAFGFELPKRFIKCRHDMRGRSEPPFAVILLERFILRSQVERERTRIALSSQERRFAGDDEGKARHALNALIGRGNQKINAERLHRDFHPAEATHGIHDEQAGFSP